MTFVEDELMRGRANAGTNFDLSTSQIERGTRRELTLGGTELFAWGVCFDQEVEFGVLMIGKWLRIAYFLTYVLPISYTCISRHF